MKTRCFIIVIFALMTHTLCAQSGESSYLNLAMEKIESGECDAAQRYYNVYKELSGITSPKFEQLLEICLNGNKKYKLGDDMIISFDYSVSNQGTGINVRRNLKIQGKIAYLEPNGEHGFAVGKAGFGRLSVEIDGILPYVNFLPTYDEALLFLQKNWKVLLQLGFRNADDFWTRTSVNSQLYKCVGIKDSKIFTNDKDKDKDYSAILVISYF